MPPAEIVFVKVQALREHYEDLAPHTSVAIKREHWIKRKSISKLLPPNAFHTVKWEALTSIKYAVLSYSWRQATWGDLLTVTDAQLVHILSHGVRRRPHHRGVNNLDDLLGLGGSVRGV